MYLDAKVRELSRLNGNQLLDTCDMLAELSARIVQECGAQIAVLQDRALTYAREAARWRALDCGEICDLSAAIAEERAATLVREADALLARMAHEQAEIVRYQRSALLGEWVNAPAKQEPHP